MFERGRDIREAKKAEILAKERRKVRTETIERVMALMEARGVALPPDVADDIFGEAAKNGS